MGHERLEVGRVIVSCKEIWWLRSDLRVCTAGEAF